MIPGINDLLYYLTDAQVNQLTLSQAQEILERVNRYSEILAKEEDETETRNLIQAIADNIIKCHIDYDNLF